MSRNVAELTEEALQLPKPDQFKLARALLEDMDFTADPAIDKAWEDEIERRIESIRSGAAKGIPFAEALKEVDKRLARIAKS